MITIKTHLIWLRTDLRIHDNTALHIACQDPSARVIAVFIATPQQWKAHNMSPRQANFIRQHLCHLVNDLTARGIEFHYQQCTDFCNQVEWLVAFCQREKVDRLFYNYQYELNERKRDQQLEQKIGKNTLCQGFDDGVLLPPGSIRNKNYQMYRVYTPFRNAFLRRLKEYDPPCLSAPMKRQKILHQINTDKITPFDYPTMPIEQGYSSGETKALSCLHTFCYQHLQRYHSSRNIPALCATSQLSAWLAIGALSPRQCYQKLKQVNLKASKYEKNSAFTWLNQLIWRDFYRHLLVAFPAISRHEPLISWTRYIAWRKDDELFNAWCAGRTGYPIVDAAMQQLACSGWINNRLRMISASFLVKDLLIDWRRGESYFMSQLIDGDLAANNGGWQWVASTGINSTPYFRIFNPITQSKRFDANGVFIRRWLPELKKVPDNYLHQLHCWSNELRVSLNYPKPIINHDDARIRTIEAYKMAKTHEAYKMAKTQCKNKRKSLSIRKLTDA